MINKVRGFTIVEIMFILSIIGILLAIVIVSWSSLQAWSRDRAREEDTQAWASTFELYRSRYVVYPEMSTSTTTPGIVCLGAVGSFPTNTTPIQATGADKCGQFKSGSTTSYAVTDSALETEVKKVGKMPVNSHETNTQIVAGGVLVGPIVYVSQTVNSGTIPVTAYFINFFENNCPSGFVLAVVADYAASGKFSALSTLLPSGSATKVCYMSKSFSYTPS